jgi:opacity protein-like surface antigen
MAKSCSHSAGCSGYRSREPRRISSARRFGRRVLIAAGALVLVSSPASAQSSSGALASGSVAAAVAGNGTDVSLAGSLGYRFNRVIGLGVELTWIKLKTADSTTTPDPYTTIIVSGSGANTLFYTTNVRIEIPTTTRRILPYAVGGGGIASTITHETVTIRSSPPVPLVPSPPIGILLPIPVPPPVSRAETSSTTGLGLTLGGGVSFLATDHVAVDIDLRAFYIRGSQSGSIGRFGVGASYRF